MNTELHKNRAKKEMKNTTGKTRMFWKKYLDSLESGNKVFSIMVVVAIVKKKSFQLKILEEPKEYSELVKDTIYFSKEILNYAEENMFRAMVEHDAGWIDMNINGTEYKGHVITYDIREKEFSKTSNRH